MKKSIIVLVILVALVVVGAVWAFNTNRAVAPENGVVQNGEVDTSDWQTYRNEELGFEIKIPQHLSVTNELNNAQNKLVSFGDGKEEFSIRIKESDVSLDKYFYLDLIPTSFVTISEKEYSVFEVPNGYCSHGICSDPFVTFSAKNGPEFYNLTFSKGGVEELSETEKTILLSFKII